MGLARTHVGWQNEHLATFLLSRVAFVATPVTVADDVGTDLFCTLYDRVTREDGVELLAARSSIAVQVKSGREPVEMRPRLEYLACLEMPYYIGVIDRGSLSLDLFSGRLLPALLSYRGRHRTLKYLLVDEVRDHYRLGDDGQGYQLQCPRVATLRAHDTAEQTQQAATRIAEDAAAALRAIVSRANQEYIFDVPGGIEIFTGQDSAGTFRSRFLRRLAEALFNAARLLKEGLPVADSELDAYLNLIATLSESMEMPKIVLDGRRAILAARERARERRHLPEDGRG